MKSTRASTLCLTKVIVFCACAVDELAIATVLFNPGHVLWQGSVLS